MLGNLTGWHMIILLLVLIGVVLVIIVAASITIIVTLSRRSARPSVPVTARPPWPTTATGGPPRPIEQRLAELDDLRMRGIVSTQEWEARRAEILRGL